MSTLQNQSGDKESKPEEFDWEKIFNPEDLNEPPFKIKPIDQKSRMDLCCHYFSHGNTIPQIVTILEERYQLKELARETPYADISLAAKQGWLKYRPSISMEWNTRLRGDYAFLRETQIPEFGGRMAVISEAAELISRNIFGIAKVLTTEFIKDFDFPNELPIPTPPRLSRKSIPSSQNQFPWWKSEVFGPIEKEKEKMLAEMKANEKKDDKTDPGKDPKPIPLEIQVRLGFSGGATIGVTAGELGRVLEPQLEKWEKDLKDLAFVTLQESGMGKKIPKGLVKRRFKVKLKLLFINIVPGFDTDPLNHPIAFLTSMINNHQEVASRAELKCYSAAPFVDITGDPEDPRKAPGPKQVEDFVADNGLDIVITSAGSLSDHHSTFRNYFRGSKNFVDKAENDLVYQILKKNGMEGDILWQAITSTKPLSFRSLKEAEREIINFRPTTLIDLKKLADQIDRKQDVVLVLAPCGYCDEPKDQALKAILNQERHLISHLVADRETIARTLGVE